MIEAGDIVMIDPNFDHPDIRSLRINDPSIFDLEGEVVYIDNAYKYTMNPEGTTERVITGQQAEVEWNDGDGNASYPVEWLINVQQFLPEMNNPNRTFRTVKLKQTVKSLFDGY